MCLFALVFLFANLKNEQIEPQLKKLPDTEKTVGVTDIIPKEIFGIKRRLLKRFVAYVNATVVLKTVNRQIAKRVRYRNCLRLKPKYNRKFCFSAVYSWVSVTD